MVAATAATHTVGDIGSLVEQANKGDANAMSELARCYQSGLRGLVKNLDAALRWYRAARDGGGLLLVAYEYYNSPGDVYGRDMYKAVSVWNMAADLGYADAMVRLGWCCQHGVGVECDKQRAVSLYTAAIARDKAHSWRLGACYLCGDGVQIDWAKAVDLFQQSASYSREAQAYLGWCYLWGCGVARDVVKGVELLNSGAAGTYLSYKAKVFLGYCHERGIGVDLDSRKANEFFNEAKRVAWGAVALGELGEHCQRGDCGAPTDKRAAVRYFQMGAEGGDAVSMFHLGVCLGDGAEHWLAMAAQFGHVGAAKMLSSETSSPSWSLCNLAAEHQDTIVGKLKKTVEYLEEQLLQERGHSAEVGSLKKQVANLEKEKEEAEKMRQQLVEEVERYKKEKEQLVRRLKETEATLCQQQIAVENLRKYGTEEVERYKAIVNTMTSLISANICDFWVEKLLGTGSHAAVFKVQFKAATSNSRKSSTTTPTSAPSSASASPTKTTTGMVMKIMFNWENTPQQTPLRRKYMAECVVLSLVPNHPNVIHPLGALVIPCLPAPFVEKIPTEQTIFRELCDNKSLAILMPHCGITLSSFLSCNNMRIEVAQNLFVQGLKAISHIESQFVVHRDIKGDNILVDPEIGKLTLIDFGEAQHCPNMEMMISATSQPWGNTGTMPPELSIFLERITRGTSGVFSYSKCDSFALALTFWDALLPQSNRFIGSTLNHDMSTFNTQSLLSEFSIPLFSSVSRHHQQPQPTKAAVTAAPDVNQNNTHTVSVLESVMIRMMDPDKAARLTAVAALNILNS